MCSYRRHMLGCGHSSSTAAPGGISMLQANAAPCMPASQSYFFMSSTCYTVKCEFTLTCTAVTSVSIDARCTPALCFLSTSICYTVNYKFALVYTVVTSHHSSCYCMFTARNTRVSSEGCSILVHLHSVVTLTSRLQVTRTFRSLFGLQPVASLARASGRPVKQC